MKCNIIIKYSMYKTSHNRSNLGIIAMIDNTPLPWSTSELITYRKLICYWKVGDE